MDRDDRVLALAPSAPTEAVLIVDGSYLSIGARQLEHGSVQLDLSVEGIVRLVRLLESLTGLHFMVRR
jgi:hypothetical protein